MAHELRRKDESMVGRVADRAATFGPGKRTLTEALPVQQPAAGPAGEGDVHAAAQRGVAGAGVQLPHLQTIQRLFGRHDVRGVQAHVGGQAEQASGAIGAEAYAMGDHVAFGGAPDLHTTAHEAAHVVQQRGGVQLKGGVGEVGDVYERHADQVADAVVQGKSAEALLDQHAGSGGGGAHGVQQAAVQRIVRIMPDQFLAGIGTDAPHATAAHVAEYVQLAILDDLERAKSFASEDQEAKLEEWRAMLVGGARTPQQKLAVLPQIILAVNGLVQRDRQSNGDTRYATTPGAGYVNTELPGGTKWGSDDAMRGKLGPALGASAEKTPALRTTEPGGRGVPLLQLPWAEAKTMLPRPLVNLLFDVRFQLEGAGAGRVIDERTAPEQHNREKSPHTGGALRSWHLDSSKVLPGNGFVSGVPRTDNVPAASLALHNHYEDTSQNGAGASIKVGADRPQGLAEYTGTGSNTEHNTKIVVDYMTKHVYLTLTHYQYWALANVDSEWMFIESGTQNLEGAEAVIHEKAAKLKPSKVLFMSPWLEIVMPTAAALDNPVVRTQPEPSSSSGSRDEGKQEKPDGKGEPDGEALELIDRRIEQSVSIVPTRTDHEEAQGLVRRSGKGKVPDKQPEQTTQVTAREGQEVVRQPGLSISPGMLLMLTGGVLIALLLLFLLLR